MLNQKQSHLVLDTGQRYGPPRESRAVNPEQTALERQVEDLMRAIESEINSCSDQMAQKEFKKAKRALLKVKDRVRSAYRT